MNHSIEKRIDRIEASIGKSLVAEDLWPNPWSEPGFEALYAKYLEEHPEAARNLEELNAIWALLPPPPAGLNRADRIRHTLREAMKNPEAIELAREDTRIRVMLKQQLRDAKWAD